MIVAEELPQMMRVVPASSSQYSAPELRLQQLNGKIVDLTSLPWPIYEIEGEISLKPPGWVLEKEGKPEPIAEICKDKEGNYFLKMAKSDTQSPANIDGAQIQSEGKISHCSKIAFQGDLYKPNGSHILICIFSKAYIAEKGIDTSSSKSIFLPKRAIFQSGGPKSLISMQSRIVNHKWDFEEREHMKKFLLVFGYGRWDKIKEASKENSVHFDAKPTSGLWNKSDGEVKAFANAFMRAICDNFVFERYELKMFLLNVIDEKPSDMYVPVNSKDWDLNLIRQRANPWGKRIQLLYRVQAFIKNFDSYFLKKHDRKPEVVFEYHNLLNFLPTSHLQGQKPCVWWTRSHDIDLIVGTFRYGYANYQNMKNCDEFGFSDLEKNLYFQDFPNADTITRRLKKLMLLIVRHEKEFGSFDFESNEAFDPDLNEFSSDEKRELFQFITEFGIPLNSEGKSHWAEIREKFYAYNTKFEFKSVNLIEKLIQEFRMVCQQILQQKNFKQKMEAKENEKGEKVVYELPEPKFDLKITAEEAENFYQNTNQLKFIRKNILANNHYLFRQNKEEYTAETQSLTEDSPAFIGGEGYKPEVQDIGLLIFLSENGFNRIGEIQNDAVYGFKDLDVDEQKLKARVDFICEFFRNQLDRISLKKKKIDKVMVVGGEVKKKVKNVVQKDNDGNIVYPITISQSLRLVSPGTHIKAGPNYHSEHNLFPVGFTSVRTYSSTINKGQKAEYTCEILDGGDKPLYRVTSSEEPERPIEKDSSTGCWVQICRKVNDMADRKKEKVTISGTERFGLLEDTVRKILEFLPGADECNRYTFKFKNA